MDIIIELPKNNVELINENNKKWLNEFVNQLNNSNPLINHTRQKHIIQNFNNYPEIHVESFESGQFIVDIITAERRQMFVLFNR